MVMQVDEFLQHYSSQYYDPVKAHEYYMKRRQLKGRSTKGMSTQQKEVWSVTKDNIAAEKKAKIKALGEQQKVAIEQLKKRAQQMRARIFEKILQGAENTISPAERDAVRMDLKSIVEQTRKSFQQARKELDVKYENIYQKEYDNIRKGVGGKSKSTSKKKHAKTTNHTKASKNESHSK